MRLALSHKLIAPAFAISYETRIYYVRSFEQNSDEKHDLL